MINLHYLSNNSNKYYSLYTCLSLVTIAIKERVNLRQDCFIPITYNSKKYIAYIYPYVI